MRLKLTTFNVENLFNRYQFLNEPWTNERYERFVMAVDIVSIASRAGDLVPETTTDIQRNNTAMAILDVAPDILVVQEIENIYTLRNFNHGYLDDYFGQILSLDGNDPRAIDVGVLLRNGLKAHVVGLRTHIDDPVDKNKPVLRQAVANFGYKVDNAIFSRDCLEVDVEAGGQVLTLLANHFKAQDGNPSSDKRRRKQAERVGELVAAAVQAGRKPIVLGDLNVDSRNAAVGGTIQAVTGSQHLADPFKTLPDKELWTHYYTHGKEVSRLDYILPDKSLQVVGSDIFRKGLTTKCKPYKGPRYPTIGPEHTEASDHCPTSVEIEI